MSAEQRPNKSTFKARGQDRRMIDSPTYTGKDRRVGERRDFSVSGDDK